MAAMGANGTKPTAVVFPGQGAQSAGLGVAWRDHPTWSVVDAAEQATGRDLSRLLLSAEAEELTATDAAQLTVFLASSMAWQAVRERVREPAVFAGHSLGQITALVASEALTLEEGSRLAVARADATRSAVDAQPGAMLAVLGSADALTEYVAEGLPPNCWLACDNAPGQVVVAGAPEALGIAESTISRLGGKARPIAVDGAFHTPLMVQAADRLSSFLSDLWWQDQVAPVIHNADATPYSDRLWSARLVEHLMVPVRWRSSMAALADLGVTDVVAVGPAASTATLVKRCLPGVRISVVAEPADLEGVEG